MIHLAPGEVRAEAVTRVVQTQERVAGTGRGQERGEAVKTAGIVQPAVEDDPLRVSVLVKGFTGPLLARDDTPGDGKCHFLANVCRHGSHKAPPMC